MDLRQDSQANCHYVELGPGRGTLAADALRAMSKFEFAPAVHFVETSETLRAQQLQNVPLATFHDRVESLPTDGPLLVVANEFFDALPIRQLILTHAGWRERVVVRDRGTKFAAMPGSYPMDGSVPAAFQNSPVGSIFRILARCSDHHVRTAQTASPHRAAPILVIDYGYTQPAPGQHLAGGEGA